LERVSEYNVNCQCRDIPLIVNGLNDESQRRADRCDVFVHYLLDNSRLACIVQATVTLQRSSPRLRLLLQHQDPHFFILESRLP